MKPTDRKVRNILTEIRRVRRDNQALVKRIDRAIGEKK